LRARRTAIITLVGLYAGSICAGALLARVGMPLPWMIGPLILTACVYMNGMTTIKVPVRTRPIGQMVIAAQVGLAFTPSALVALLSLIPLLIGAALLTAALASAVAVLVARMTEIRLAQAFLGTFPISPVEAAVMAEKLGCETTPVILSQTIRIAAVVILIPLSVYAMEGWPARNGVAPAETWQPMGNVVLAFFAVSGALTFKWLRISNPFFLGPLAFSAFAAAAGHQVTAFPIILLSAAQIVLGTWLGSNFRRDLLAKGGRLVATTLLSTMALLLIITAAALGLAVLTGVNWKVLVLGLAPGSVTEMALTAKFLGADLAVVTAFQLTRIFIFMPNAPWLIRLIDQYEQRRNTP